MTTADAVDYRRKEIRRLMGEVDAALQQGNLAESAQKLWGAAVHAIAAVAERRGWRHDSDALLAEVVDRLAEEENVFSQILGEQNVPCHLLGLYMLALAYRQNSVDNPPSASKIRYGKKRIAEFIYTLENPKPPTLQDLAPPPPATVINPVAYYRNESRQRLQQVDDEMDLGLGEHARDSLWAATVQGVKAAAIQRGWPHDTEVDLNNTIDRMIAEEGMPTRLFHLYLIGSAYSRRGWQMPKDPESIRYTKVDIAEFIGQLEAWDKSSGKVGDDSP